MCTAGGQADAARAAAQCRLTGQASTVGDWSVVITGLLYGLTLPPGLPLWMVVLGGVVGVGLGKFLFGGLFNVNMK